jgi:hypothetical protein
VWVEKLVKRANISAAGIFIFTAFIELLGLKKTAHTKKQGSWATY